MSEFALMVMRVDLLVNVRRLLAREVIVFWKDLMLNCAKRWKRKTSPCV